MRRNFPRVSPGVRLGKRWGFVDKSGKVVINPLYDEVMPFSDGLARVKVGRKTGYIDASGKFVWNPNN